MRAATYTRTGPAADVPELEEVPVPAPGADEVRVPAPGAGEARGQTVLIQGAAGAVRQMCVQMALAHRATYRLDGIAAAHDRVQAGALGRTVPTLTSPDGR